MDSENTYEKLCWYAIHTHQRQEDRVEENLRSWNVETFVPRIKRLVRQPYSDKCVYRAMHLFRGYIFARFEFNSMHGKIRYTRGVHSVVNFNNKAVPVDNQIIDSMKFRVQEDGFIKLGEEFEYGDEVTIEAGQFANFVGVFQREMNASERVVLLLNAINFQPMVVVEKEFVTKRLTTAKRSPGKPFHQLKACRSTAAF